MNTCTISLEETLEQAKAAALAKSQEIWDRDEHQDRGISLNGTQFTFVPGASGANNAQNADIYQDSARAFRKVLIDAGFEKAIKKFWTYID